MGLNFRRLKLSGSLSGKITIKFGLSYLMDLARQHGLVIEELCEAFPGALHARYLGVRLSPAAAPKKHLLMAREKIN